MSTIAGEGPLAPWRPTPMVAGSMGLHCLAGVGALFEPQMWPWAVGAIAANHALLGAFVLSPRSTLLGPNLTRLPDDAIARGEIALTFDDGPDPRVTPRILDLLEARGARATFFCIAEKAARHPELCREIARRGHAVENHSHGHLRRFAMLGLGGIRREVVGAQATLAQCAGRAPRFFRAPAGFRNPMLDPVLHENHLRLVSWTRRAFDTQSGDAALVARRLCEGLQAGDILLLHDGHCAITAAGQPVVLAALPLVLDAIESRGLTPVSLDHAIAP